MSLAQTEQEINTKNFIVLKGVNVHNIKNIDLNIPKGQLIVITGVSGSGKSSLAFDTIYAEGQRRYVESLSAYVRQFMGRITKPDVKLIEGITPAVAIQQKVISSNPRSTVGTVTEVYDYLKLLYTRLGETFSPISGKKVVRDTPETVMNNLLELPEKTKIILLTPIKSDSDESVVDLLNVLLKEGFSRVKFNGEITEIQELKSIAEKSEVVIENLALVIDRLVIDYSVEGKSRLYDSIQTAFNSGEGTCIVEVFKKSNTETLEFNNRFEMDGIKFQEPSIHFFSFNNPLGACKTCEGFGNIIGIDKKLVIPNTSLSIYDGAIDCWKGEKMGEWKTDFVNNAHRFDFPVHTPYSELTDSQKRIVWEGNEFVEGVDDFFKMVTENSYKIQYRVMLARYRGKTLCLECQGSRLNSETQNVKIQGIHIGELLKLPISKLITHFKNLQLSKTQAKIAKRLLIEIESRLDFIDKVGLGYLRLDRLSNSLSGGESQRISLAKSLGSSLVGSTYILDEPSIGLHSRDGERLIEVLKSLQALGNTVIVVEHDEDMMKNADLIIDMGPFAGSQGGDIVAQGNYNHIISHKKSLTGKYLSGQEQIEVPSSRRSFTYKVSIKGARENNLKNINVDIPLNSLVAITGVSGSGKSTLLRKIFYPALRRHFGNFSDTLGEFTDLSGDLDKLSGVEFIDQNPIGKSSRSNPVTYVKAYDEIRALYSSLPLAQMRGYKPSFFSFNVDGGRCQKCEGDGVNVIEMQFMADVILPCDECKGQRFKSEILDIKYGDLSISDLLQTTIDDAVDFFNAAIPKEKVKPIQTILKKVINKLKPLQKVGLGYVKLGQSSNTLSGGEAQRIKLASFLTKGGNSDNNLLFIFDEPTTGLHFHDVKKLLVAFDELIKQGHSVVLIEHHLDVIKCADWIIDLGPEGGDLGGDLVYSGLPEDILKEKRSITASYLKEKLKN